MTKEKFVFKKVALGGTFDKFHLGHEKLIDTAFEFGEFVLIGITSDNFAKKLSKIHEISPFDERVKSVREYVKRKWSGHKYEIFHLEDPYGPTITDKDIEAVVVSEETINRGKKINDIRIEKGLTAITLLVVDMILAEDGLPITSTRIHLGFVDRFGKVLIESRREKIVDYNTLLKI